MFFGCSSLNKLNINNFNFNKITDVHFMFCGLPDEVKKIIRSKFKSDIKGDACI